MYCMQMTSIVSHHQRVGCPLCAEAAIWNCAGCMYVHLLFMGLLTSGCASHCSLSVLTTVVEWLRSSHVHHTLQLHRQHLAGTAMYVALQTYSWQHHVVWSVASRLVCRRDADVGV